MKFYGILEGSLRISFHQHRVAEAAGCAGRKETKLSAFFDQAVRRSRQEAHSSSAEGVTNAEAAAPRVQFLERRAPELAGATLIGFGEKIRIQGSQVSENLSRKSFVIFKDRDIRQTEASLVQNSVEREC